MRNYEPIKNKSKKRLTFNELTEQSQRGHKLNKPKRDTLKRQWSNM